MEYDQFVNEITVRFEIVRKVDVWQQLVWKQPEASYKASLYQKMRLEYISNSRAVIHLQHTRS